MTTVTIDRKELCTLIGKNISMRDLQDMMFDFGSDTEDVDGENVTFEVTADRPDLLSVEGIARMIRFHYRINKKMEVPSVKASKFVCKVEKNVQGVRQYIACAVVENIRMTDKMIKSLMQVQEKLHASFGRERKKGAIGIHDMDRIRGTTIIYKAISPNKDSFVPLGKKRKMTLAETLKEHEKGKKYGRIIEGSKLYPVIYDDEGIFSFPPIINSARTEVTKSTKNLFIDVTGEDERTIGMMLNIILYALSDRGGKMSSVKIGYPERAKITPNLEVIERRLQVGYVNNILGSDFSKEKVSELLGMAGFGVSIGKSGLDVRIPPYRADILHGRDLVDEVGRSYGFNNFKPSYPESASTGSLSTTTKSASAVRGALIGLGFQDLLNFMLTNSDANYTKMDSDDDGKAVELENPFSENYTMVRTWLLPSLMEVLSNNRNRQYPQNMSEVGQAMVIDERKDTGVDEVYKAAAVVCHLNTQYNEIKSMLQALVQSFGAKLKTPPKDHPSFIKGRCAEVVINGKNAGVIGEISPSVLSNWGIEMPVAAFEIDISYMVEK